MTKADAPFATLRIMLIIILLFVLFLDCIYISYYNDYYNPRAKQKQYSFPQVYTERTFYFF